MELKKAYEILSNEMGDYMAIQHTVETVQELSGRFPEASQKMAETLEEAVKTVLDEIRGVIYGQGSFDKERCFSWAAFGNGEIGVRCRTLTGAREFVSEAVRRFPQREVAVDIQGTWNLYGVNTGYKLVDGYIRVVDAENDNTVRWLSYE